MAQRPIREKAAAALFNFIEMMLDEQLSSDMQKQQQLEEQCVEFTTEIQTLTRDIRVHFVVFVYASFFFQVDINL